MILMSTILNYFTLAPGSDAVFIGNLPSYAAIAWHYEKIAHKGRDEKAFLDEVRTFARGPYAEALAQGQNLPQAQVDALAVKLAGYTGLSVQYIKEANLRVNPSRFRKELLRDQRMILGRYDARFEGSDADAAGENPGYDPSSTGITGAFVSAFHDYLDRELKYTTKETYFPRGMKINEEWDHTHHAPGAGGPGPQPPPLRDAYVAGDLADAMRKNPRLKVFSANGLFDLATPFFITEYDLAHMELDPKLRGNIEFAYYHSGHMIYLNVDALKQLKSDLAAFHTRASGGSPSAGAKAAAVHPGPAARRPFPDDWFFRDRRGPTRNQRPDDDLDRRHASGLRDASGRAPSQDSHSAGNAEDRAPTPTAYKASCRPMTYPSDTHVVDRSLAVEARHFEQRRLRPFGAQSRRTVLVLRGHSGPDAVGSGVARQVQSRQRKLAGQRGTRAVDFLIPEFWRAMTTDDAKLLRAVSTPGLLTEFQAALGPI